MKVSPPTPIERRTMRRTLYVWKQGNFFLVGPKTVWIWEKELQRTCFGACEGIAQLNKSELASGQRNALSSCCFHFARWRIQEGKSQAETFKLRASGGHEPGRKMGNANRAGKTLNGPTSSIPFSCSSCSFHKIARYFERGPNSKYARKFLWGCSSLNGVPIHGPIQARPFLPVLRELRLLSLSPPNRRWTRPRRLRSLFLPSPAGNALALAFPQFSFSPDFRYLK